MRSPILLSLTVSVSISVAGSALAQSLRPNIQQQPQGAFYSEPGQAPVGAQAEPASSEKLIDTSRAIIDASRAIQDLSETLNTAPAETPLDDQATAEAEAALQAAQSGQESVEQQADSPFTTPSQVEPVAPTPASTQPAPAVQVTTGSEAPPAEQINPWRVPNSAKVYDETGTGVATKTQELIQSLGIDQQIVSASAQTDTPRQAEKPVSTPVATVSKPLVPVFSTPKPADALAAKAPVTQAPQAVITTPETSITAIQPAKPAVAAAPAPVVEPTPVAASPSPVAAELTPVATAPAPVAATTTPVATAPAAIAAELTPVVTAPAPAVAKSTPAADLGTPVYESVETASSGAPIPFSETASLSSAPATATASVAPVPTEVARKPAVETPVAPTPKVEMAKATAPAPVQVAQPVKKVEEKPVVARREFPSVRNAFARLGKPPLLVSRLKSWSTEPVEDWTDPSSVSSERISPRKGIENMGKKIATFGHVKSWGGKSEAQSQVAAKPPVEKQDATVKPAVEGSTTTLERIKPEPSADSTTPDTPKTWY